MTPLFSFLPIVYTKLGQKSNFYDERENLGGSEGKERREDVKIYFVGCNFYFVDCNFYFVEICSQAVGAGGW